MKRLKVPNFDFVKNKWPFIFGSIVLIVMSLWFLAVKGLNYGIDFKGGIKLLYAFSPSEPVDERMIESALAKAGLNTILVQRYGKPEENSFVLRAELDASESQKLDHRVTEALKQDLKLGSANLLQNEYVGPKAGKELKRKGQFAIIVSWILMLIYVGFRFDFNFAPGAILALVHDVLIAVGVFAISGREVNLTVLAAFLTIIGYSINDTIVIFDRVRENLEKHKSFDLIKVVNLSLNETLSRTIVTSLTVFFVVVVLFLMSDGDIQNFALAMIIGVVVGSYSTLFIASPFYMWMKNLRQQ